jgi:hypothetical protein
LKPPKIPDPPGDHLKIKLGSWLEATASGRFAIAASVLVVVIVAISKLFGG